MTYSNMIEHLAYRWDAAFKNYDKDDAVETAFDNGMLYGKMIAVSMMENKTYQQVKNDVLEYAHNHGRLIGINELVLG